MSRKASATLTRELVIWHDVECAAYDLDLPLWRRLAGDAAGPVLDIGCGTGRVALDLARRGHDVTGLDAEPELVHELIARARARGLHIPAVVGDARSFRLERRFALAIAPMQVVQLFDGPGGRAAALTCVRDHLLPGGVFAAALADPLEGVPDGELLPPLPDVREDDGWVHASTPVAVRRSGKRATIERHRQSVSPAGEIRESVATIALDLIGAAEFETEAAAAGFRVRERDWVPESREWAGSTVVVLEAP